MIRLEETLDEMRDSQLNIFDWLNKDDPEDSEWQRLEAVATLRENRKIMKLLDQKIKEMKESES